VLILRATVFSTRLPAVRYVEEPVPDHSTRDTAEGRRLKLANKHLDPPCRAENAYAATVAIVNNEAMGWLRALVGIALIVAPGAPMRLAGSEPPTAASLLLMRTIGIRDLALGLGTVVAARSEDTGEVGRWNSAALLSDSLDTVVSLASFRSIGKRDAWAAAALAFSFACGDLRARRAVTD
jgi:hypothetical protein